MRALSEFFLPVFIIAVLAIGFFCRINVYDSFVTGAREGVKLVLSVFPYICAVLIATELFSVSGMSAALTDLLAPLFRFLGIPEQLCELVIVRPLSGNGSLAVLEKLIAEYGADSYIARCGSVIVGASETVFYVCTVYVSTTKVRKLRYALPVSLFCTLLGAVVSCLLCTLM